MTWLKDVIGTEKAIIAMVHLEALPGDPYYDKKKGMDYVVEWALKDIIALQEGGVDALLFANEFSHPFLTDVGAETVGSMARIIGEIKSYIKIPFGTLVIWDAKKSLDLAVATDAKFVRVTCSGVYGSDFGFWDLSAGEIVRHQYQIGAENVKLMYEIAPHGAAYVGNRELTDIAKTTIHYCQPDAFCLPGRSEDIIQLKKVKEVIGDTVLISNMGVTFETLQDNLQISDGATVGTVFKVDGIFENHVDKQRVKKYMEKVREFRNSNKK